MNHWWVYAIIFMFVLSIIEERSRRNRSKSLKTRPKKKSPQSCKNNRASHTKRDNDVILRTPIEELTWKEFECLWAMYFESQNYSVETPGLKGKDGGVDLVLTHNRTKERTAVQCKHQVKTVGPEIIRALDSSRRNTKPSCHYGHLITSAEISEQTRNEAYDRHIECWHGGELSIRLSKWPAWKGDKKSKRRKVNA